MLGTLYHWLELRKHTLLLALVCLGLLIQPFAALNVEFYSVAIMLVVFLIVFEHRWQKVVGLVLGLPGVALTWFSYLVADRNREVLQVTYHSILVVFLAFAVFTILAGVFNTKRIRRDHVIGAFSGLILTALAFGNLYLVIELLYPESFHVREEIAWHLQDERMRRFLFNHFSFTTLTTVGTMDVEPVTPSVRTLSWFESLFGQFYFAVFIGQLIGLKLSQSSETPKSHLMPPIDRP